jgi:hypothetical protein
VKRRDGPLPPRQSWLREQQCRACRLPAGACNAELHQCGPAADTLQKAKKQRENVGVELYGFQQTLAKLQLQLERTQESYANIQAVRLQVSPWAWAAGREGDTRDAAQGQGLGAGARRNGCRARAPRACAVLKLGGSWDQIPPLPPCRRGACRRRLSQRSCVRRWRTMRPLLRRSAARWGVPPAAAPLPLAPRARGGA